MKIRDAIDVLRRAYGIPRDIISTESILFHFNIVTALTYNLTDWDKWREENE